jgi:hypothetical protein
MPPRAGTRPAHCRSQGRPDLARQDETNGCEQAGDNVRVWIQDVPKENWGIAGVSAKDLGR